MDQSVPAGSLKSWEVIFWDVGQGDATSIRLPTGDYILIDTGPVSATSGSNPLVQWFLSAPAPKRIKYVLITHNDLDHVGGLLSLAGEAGQSIETVENRLCKRERGE
jgi:competence protein ComEC